MSAGLTLDPTAEFPRLLVLALADSGLFVVDMYASWKTPLRRLSFTFGNLTDWHLDIESRELFFGRNSISLSDTEVAQIREVFEPVGLFVHSFPTADTQSLKSAKVAARAALPPSERGTTPLPVCTGRGALDSEASILAYALTNGEVY